MDIDDPRLVEARKRFTEHIERVDNMILTVLKAQITVERFMIALIDAHGRDPKKFFFTADKIAECKKINPPEVCEPLWKLLEFCTHVRNELAHSLDDAQIKAKTDKVRAAYLDITKSERQKQSIREMDDTHVVTSAFYHFDSHIVIATEKHEERSKKKT